MSAKKSYKIIFITEVGHKAGWGHYIRSRALADELISMGAEIDFYVKSKDRSSSGTNDPVSILEGELTSFLENFFSHANIVVLDLYGFSSEILKSLETWPVSVCIDDGSELEFNCTLVVNPNVNGEFIHRSGPRTRYLHGRDSIILRPQFDNLPKRKCREKATHLLVAFGGTDSASLTPWAVRFLKNHKDLPFQTITVMVGDLSVKETMMPVVKDDVRFHIFHGVENVVSLLYAADVGIIAAGTMLYEAAVTGMPSLVVSLNEPQAREARAFASRGVVRYLGSHKTINNWNWMEELRALIPREVRQEMAKNSQSLIDSQGRKRIADAIMGLARRQGAKVEFQMPPGL